MRAEFTGADGETLRVPAELIRPLYEELWRVSAPGGISAAAKVRYAETNGDAERQRLSQRETEALHAALAALQRES
jgi:hypothetical protein